MTTLIKKLSMLTLGLAMATGVGIALQENQETQFREVHAAITQVSAPTIKVTLDTTWMWDDWYINYYGLSYVAGHSSSEFDGNLFRGVSFSSKTITFPWYVNGVAFIINGVDYSTTKELKPLTINQPGAWTVSGLDWDYVANKANSKLTRTGDSFDEATQLFVTTPGYTAGVDSTKTRLWLDRGNYGTTDAIVVLNVADVLYEPSGYIEKHGGYYYAYYDVSLSIISGQEFKFYKLKNDCTTLWNTSTTLTYASGDSAYLFQLPESSGDTLIKTVVTGTIKNSFFAKVLEGYLTCSTSLENGYAAISTVDNSFLPKVGEIWGMEGNLDAAPDITDYSGVGTSNYDSARGTGAAVDPYAKYQALWAMYNAHPALGASNVSSMIDDQSVIGILMVGIIGLSTIGFFYFLTRKKVQVQ